MTKYQLHLSDPENLIYHFGDGVFCRIEGERMIFFDLKKKNFVTMSLDKFESSSREEIERITNELTITYAKAKFKQRSLY